MQTNDIAKRKKSFLDAVHLVKEGECRDDSKSFWSRWIHQKDEEAGDEHEDRIPEKPVDHSEEVHGDWTYVDSHINVAKVTTEEQIFKAVINYQTIEETDINNVEEKKS